jgi:hypothetical protein
MWLTRGTKKCFYLSKRINSRPRSVYVGTGPAAEAAADEVEARKRERLRASNACAALKARIGTAEHPLDALCEGLDVLASASLLALGYHRHDRHAWRKRRDEHLEVPVQ